MRYSLLLTLILGASSLVAFEQNKKVDSSMVDQTNAELQKIKAEAALVKEELAYARAEKIEEQARGKAHKIEQEAFIKAEDDILKKNQSLVVSVVGQGVAPMNTISPAQAYALAKRAAIADAYRAIAEKVKGVKVDGQDTIKNMMIQKSTIRTNVQAMVKNANIVETVFKEGLCEVEMEIMLSYSDFVQQ